MTTGARTLDTRRSGWHPHEVVGRVLAAVTPGRGTGHARTTSIFIVASTPAALIGAWNAGLEWLAANPATIESPSTWRHALFEWGAPAESVTGIAQATLVGLSLWLPLLVAAGVAAVAWESLFSSLRRRAPDPGWAMSCWLFVLLMPAGTSVTLVMAGMSFGIVFGSLVFGGTGRYIVSPAALGALFVHFAYPAALPADADWHRLVVDGSLALGSDASWWAYFGGREHGLLGTVSALAALAGALFLVRSRATSARTLGGAIAGMAVAATAAWLAGGPLPPHWQFALGSGTFCMVFLLTDPTTQSLTRTGRWIHGALFGVLVILMREADPARPDAALFAVVLAALAVPLIDDLVLRLDRRRHGSGLSLR